MSVIIHEMRLPTSITKAEFGIDAEGDPLCVVYPKEYEKTNLCDAFFMSELKTPHGKLIDVNTAVNMLLECAEDAKYGDAKWFFLYAAKIIENCPAVVEAEEV